MIYVMCDFNLLDINDVQFYNDGVVYQGEIGVFVLNDTKDNYLLKNNAFYINAFSYIIIIEGYADISVNGEKYLLSSDTLAILSPLHLIRFAEVSKRFRCLLFCINKKFVDKIGYFDFRKRILTGVNMINSPVLNINGNDKKLLVECVMNISGNMKRVDHMFLLELVQNSLIMFYIELDNLISKEIVEYKTGLNSRKSKVLQDFMTLLLDNFKEEHNVAFYANELNITTQYLTKIVKSITGKTITDFIYEFIYNEAKSLLKSTNMSVQQIANILHFSDQSSFNKFFKRKSGLPPTAFRE